MVGKVEEYLLEKIEKEGTIHLTLVDPEKTHPQSAAHIVQEAESCQTAAIMVVDQQLYPLHD